MCITEYNEEETLQAIGNEKFVEGRAVGKDDINSNSTGWWIGADGVCR